MAAGDGVLSAFSHGLLRQSTISPPGRKLSPLHSCFLWWGGWEKDPREDLALRGQALLASSTGGLGLGAVELQLWAMPAEGGVVSGVSLSV